MFTEHAGDTVQFLLLVLVIIFAVVGNGSVCCLLFRFKALRTIPNVLVLDLAIVDGLNALINASLFTGYFVIELDILRGRELAVFTEASYRCFLFLNLTTKLLLMLDRYFVVTHGIRYTIWKSRPKVCFIIMIKWLFCLAAGVGSSSALWKIDLGDAQVLDYRGEYLETNGKMFKRLTILINHGLYLCLALGTFLSIRKTNEEFRGNTGKKKHASLIKVNNSSKVKASKTIVVLISCDFVFYLPMLLHLYLVLTPGFEKHGWFPFFAHYFAFMSSVNNPIIYFSRTQRFRLALLKMLRDPCGSGEIFEFRTLPDVKLDPQKKLSSGHVKNTASSKPQRRRQTRTTLDSLEMESNAHVNLATLQEHPELEERKSNDRSSASIDDLPVAFVHRSTSDQDGPESKPFDRQVNVILSNRSSERKRKCSTTELKDGNKPGSESSSNFSSRDNTQESALSLSEDSNDSYDTWL